MNRRVWSYGLLTVGFLLSSVPSAQADGLRVVTHRFDTATQMLLANEINESGEPFAEALGYNLDDLDPFLPGNPDVTAYTLGIENYEYSRYQLGNRDHPFRNRPAHDVGASGSQGRCHGTAGFRWFADRCSQWLQRG